MELDCKGKHIALHANIRLGRKSLAVTNLLAYITAVKRFKIQAPRDLNYKTYYGSHCCGIVVGYSV
jgi:hypothetical protein